MKGPSLLYRFRGFLRRTCWPILPLVGILLTFSFFVQWSVSPELALPSGHVLRIGALGFFAIAGLVCSAKRWRNQTYKEVIDMRNLQRSARNRTIAGIAAIVAGIAASDSSSGAAQVAGRDRRVLPAVGVQGVCVCVCVCVCA